MEYTVVIRAKNPGSLFDVGIASLRNQTHSPAQIIVVDSGSEPAFKQHVIDSGCERVDYHHEPPFIPGRAINLAMQRVTTPYVCIFSPHCELIHPESSERSIGALNKDPELVAVRMNMIFPEDPLIREVDWSQIAVAEKRNYHSGQADFPCTWLRSHALVEHPMDENMVINEDQFWLYERIGEGWKQLHFLQGQYYYRNPYYNFWKRYQGTLLTNAALFPENLTWKAALNAFRSMLWYTKKRRWRHAWEQGVDFIALVRYRLIGKPKHPVPLKSR